MIRTVLAFLLLFAQYIPAGGRASTVLPPPPIRGTSQFTSGSGAPSSINIPLPTGTAAGDFAILFADAAYNITATSGWTTIRLYNGGTWNVYIADKAIDSGDVSAGFATVSAGGNFDMTGVMITFVGATGGIREFQDVTPGAYTNPQTLSTTSAPLTSDEGVFFTTQRGSCAVDITPAVGSLNPTYTQTVTSSNSHTKFGVQQMLGGVQTTSYSCPGGFPLFFIQIVVKH